jgi:hypothetical protein
MTRQEIDKKMDELAREYHETQDPKIREEINRLVSLFIGMNNWSRLQPGPRPIKGSFRFTNFAYTPVTFLTNQLFFEFGAFVYPHGADKCYKRGLHKPIQA